MSDFRIGVVGVAGRMGQAVAREIALTPGCRLSGGSEAPGAAALGRDLGEACGLGRLGIAIGADTQALFTLSDAIIDFTRPAASVRHAELAAASGKILVIGTTGLDPDQERVIAAASRRAPIVHAPNMSLGVNVLAALVEQVAARLGPEFDIEILEIHHRHKIDAPSGTALALGEAAARGRKVKLAEVKVAGRGGHTGAPTGARTPGAIGFASLRGGAEVGDHIVMFCGEEERIELVHKAGGRRIYARGAVSAALWARGRAPGLYSMRDVLGLG